jgi:hypothetical protein
MSDDNAMTRINLRVSLPGFSRHGLRGGHTTGHDAGMSSKHLSQGF